MAKIRSRAPGSPLKNYSFNDQFWQKSDVKSGRPGIIGAAHVVTGVPVTWGMFSMRGAPDFWRPYFDDYDTFLNPDGTVFVSGTTGGISIWSWRAGQRAALLTRGAMTILNGYRIRVDRADWQLGHSTTTRNGVIVDAHDTVDSQGVVLINEALALLDKAIRHARPGAYQIQAAIAGLHARAASRGAASLNARV